MSFIESVNVMFKSGLMALVVGFAFYFLIRTLCRVCSLEGFWRIGLTVAAILFVIAPQTWDLVFNTSDFRDFGVPPAATAEGLWLAIKTMLVLGPLGHIAGMVVEKCVD